MRRYETVWVVHGDLPDEEVKATIDKFTRIIATQGGTLLNLEEWGRRKLAYKVKGTFRGCYVLADFAGLSATVKELERNFRIDDRIIRYLTFKKADHVNVEAVLAEMAARAPKAVAATEAAAPAEVAAALPEAVAPAEVAAALPEAAPPVPAPPPGEEAPAASPTPSSSQEE